MIGYCDTVLYIQHVLCVELLGTPDYYKNTITISTWHSTNSCDHSSLVLSGGSKVDGVVFLDAEEMELLHLDIATLDDLLLETRAISASMDVRRGAFSVVGMQAVMLATRAYGLSFALDQHQVAHRF